MEKIPLERAVCLDRRAAMGTTIGMVVFLVAVTCWSLAVPFLFLPRWPAAGLATALCLIALGLITSGVLTAGAVKSLGGETVVRKDVVASVSTHGIQIGDDWRNDVADFRKIKVRRYKGGCMDVVLHLIRGGQIRLSPSTQGGSAQGHKDEYCRLCEHIRSILTNP